MMHSHPPRFTTLEQNFFPDDPWVVSVVSYIHTPYIGPNQTIRQGNPPAEGRGNAVPGYTGKSRGGGVLDETFAAGWWVVDPTV